MTEHFDIVITSNTLEQLDGISVISALKVTNNFNNKIPAIMVSSDEEIKGRFKEGLAADYIVAKDVDFVRNLKKAIEVALFSQGKEAATSKIEKILYVEDDKILQKFFKMSMAKHPSVETIVVSSRDEVGIKVDDFSPDLILLDYLLVGFTGEDVLEDLQIHPKAQDIPIIFLTATPENLELCELQKKGNVRGILGKPVNFKTIFQEIDKHLNSD